MKTSLRHRHKDQINEWIDQTCRANNVPEFADQISWSFNNRFTRRMGDANYITQEMRFSAPLWERASLAEQRNTVKHETAHLIARKLFGRGIKQHGKEWRACMYNAGETPERCHTVNRDGLRRKQKRYPAECGCGSRQLSGIRRSRILKGSRYRCSRCMEIIKLKFL